MIVFLTFCGQISGSNDTASLFTATVWKVENVKLKKQKVIFFFFQDLLKIIFKNFKRKKKTDEENIEMMNN